MLHPSTPLSSIFSGSEQLGSSHHVPKLKALAAAALQAALLQQIDDMQVGWCGWVVGRLQLNRKKMPCALR